MARPHRLPLDGRLTRVAVDRVIEVFADIWCPFTHVGLRLVAAELRDRGHPDVAIRVRSWPLEWVNGRPMDPAVTLHHVREIRDQLSTDFFAGFDPSRFPRSTVPVLALAACAYAADLQLGQALSFEVRRRLFEDGVDVSEPDTLMDVASSFGLGRPEPDDYAAVVADWKEGRRREVAGSPHFFCAGQSVFCPSLDIAKDGEGGASIHTNLGRLREFLDRCLAGHAQGA